MYVSLFEHDLFQLTVHTKTLNIQKTPIPPLITAAFTAGYIKASTFGRVFENCFVFVDTFVFLNALVSTEGENEFKKCFQTPLINLDDALKNSRRIDFVRCQYYSISLSGAGNWNARPEAKTN